MYPPSLLNSDDYVSQLIGEEQKVSQFLVDKLVQKSVWALLGTNALREGPVL